MTGYQTLSAMIFYWHFLLSIIIFILYLYLWKMMHCFILWSILIYLKITSRFAEVALMYNLTFLFLFYFCGFLNIISFLLFTATPYTQPFPLHQAYLSTLNEQDSWYSHSGRLSWHIPRSLQTSGRKHCLLITPFLFWGRSIPVEDEW